jgi:hypothetical protein
MTLADVRANAVDRLLRLAQNAGDVDGGQAPMALEDPPVDDHGVDVDRMRIGVSIERLIGHPVARNSRDRARLQGRASRRRSGHRRQRLLLIDGDAQS